ncbi:murein hydrolase activator [uncultured Gammaproteobacteria bacterium]
MPIFSAPPRLIDPRASLSEAGRRSWSSNLRALIISSAILLVLVVALVVVPVRFGSAQQVGAQQVGPKPDVVRVTPAEPPRQELRRIEDTLTSEKSRRDSLERQSGSLERELGELRARLVRMADEAARADQDLTELEQKLEGLAGDEQVQTQHLEADRARIVELLAALQRLALVPPEALLVRPGAPVEAVRAAMLLRAAVPALNQRTVAVINSLRQLAITRRQLAEHKQRVAKARATLTERQRDLSKLVERREVLLQRTEAEKVEAAARMAKLTAQASDLRQLLERLEAERKEAERREAERKEAERRATDRRTASQRAAEQLLADERAKVEAAEAQRKDETSVEAASSSGEAVGSTPGTAVAVEATQTASATPAVATPAVVPTKAGDPRLPVAGRVVIGYGERDTQGGTSRGLHLVVRPAAAVVSPYSGTVRFAGPFKTFGHLLIVEHSNGYHSLLAGLGSIDVAVGQKVTAGEPVGAMADQADGAPELYFELRRNGQPINPWRVPGARDGKGQG